MLFKITSWKHDYINYKWKEKFDELRSFKINQEIAKRPLALNIQITTCKFNNLAKFYSNPQNLLIWTFPPK